MRVVLQRVGRASVSVDGSVVASIERGLCLLVGIEEGDDEADVDVAADKVMGLRVFPDAEGKMNLSVGDVGGQILVVSQFTLVGDIRRGRRPSFTRAAAPEDAEPLVLRLVEACREAGVVTEMGVFGAAMEVDLVNDGPVTLVVDVKNASLG